MLIELLTTKYIVAGTDHMDVHIPAAAGVIAVLPGKADGVAVLPEHVGAIDLKMYRRRRRPDEAAHPPVANGVTFLGARRGLVVIQIGAGDDGSIINARGLRKHHRVEANSNDAGNHVFGHGSPVARVFKPCRTARA